MRMILLGLALLLGCTSRVEVTPTTTRVEVTHVEAPPGVSVTVLELDGAAIVWLDESAVAE